MPGYLAFEKLCDQVHAVRCRRRRSTARRRPVFDMVIGANGYFMMDRKLFDAYGSFQGSCCPCASAEGCTQDAVANGDSHGKGLPCLRLGADGAPLHHLPQAHGVRWRHVSLGRLGPVAGSRRDGGPGYRGPAGVPQHQLPVSCRLFAFVC